jgi:exodeoxyribonuclease VII large subunit
MPQEFFTVHELNDLVRDVVQAGFPRSLWVCGEIQNLDRYRSKAHLFFDLVEKAPGAKDIKAKIGVTIWAGIRPKIEAVLRKVENGFELKDGIEVKFSGKVEFYPPYGTLRLIIDDIDPVYTLGKIAQDRQKLVLELAKAGVLEKNKARHLPVVPLNIGLISAFDSAAYNDFLHELKRPGFAYKVFFYNSVMQGKNCEGSVAGAVKYFNTVKGLDALVITRGGGSIAELSAFDSRLIADSVAGSSYPVLTGIGHEINTTITDMAAHTSQKTPTAVAQFLNERVAAFLDGLDRSYGRLAVSAFSCLDDERSFLKDLALALKMRTHELLKGRADEQSRLAERLRFVPARISRHRKDLGRVFETLIRTIHLRISDSKNKIAGLERMVELSAPEKTLKRGFSLTRDSRGRVIRSADAVKKGDLLSTDFSDGRVASVAQAVNLIS